MTIAQSVVVVDPRGRSMVVDVQDMAGVSVTAYDAAIGGNTRTLPLTITSATSFYLAKPGDYQVSALLGGREIAGLNGAKVTVTPPANGSVSVVPALDSSEVLDVAASGGLARSVEGIPWFLAGHSRGVVPPFVAGTFSPGANWITRLDSELHSSSLTNASVGGYMAQDVAARILGTTQTIGPNFKGLVFLDVGTNDMSSSMTAKRIAGITNGVKAMIAGAQAASKVVESDATFVYTGTWAVQTNAEYGSGASKSSTTSGDKVTITLPSLAAGLNYTVLLTATDSAKVAGCTAVEVKLDGAVISTISLNDQMQFTNTAGATLEFYGVGLYPLTIPGNGSGRTLVLTSQASGQLGVDDLLIPQVAPPQVMLVGQSAFTANYSSSGGDTSLAAVNAAIQAAGSGFTGVTYVDMASAFVPATMCSSVDNLHANDLGHATRAAVMTSVLQALPYRSGMNLL